MANEENIPNPEEQEAQKTQMLVDTGNAILELEEAQAQFKKHLIVEGEILKEKFGDRLVKDKSLRESFDSSIGTGKDMSLGAPFLKPLNSYVKEYYKKYYKAVQSDNAEERDKAFAQVKMLKQELDAIREMKKDYADNMFGSDDGTSQLSKGCSQQQVSIADQLYTHNTELRVEIGSEKMVKAQLVDFYNMPINLGECYGVVQDFTGNETYVNFKEGNKDLFVPPMEKALEYQRLRKEQSDIASEAMATNSQPSLDVDGIAYQMKKLLIDQNTVLSFCHDDLMEDGSTFKEHLYNHQSLEHLSYNGETQEFDLAQFDENGDGHLDEADRVRLIDAITNVDSDFFDIELLRDLVTEYYTKKIYMAWGKQFGFPDDWLFNIDVNKVKLNIQRFKVEREKAEKRKHPIFMFDGKQYSLEEADKFLQVAMFKEHNQEVDYVKKYNLDK